ncbi:MAG TPA: hypothetical protein VI386_19150 [Candidatus Sulfotelmatobacter sp.]
MASLGYGQEMLLQDQLQRKGSTLRMTPSSRVWPLLAIVLISLACLSVAQGEECQTATDMDAATRTALSNAGQKYFDMIARGDTASLKQNSIPAIAADFAGIEGTVKDHQKELSGTRATARPPFLLEASGTAAIPHAEFFCGVFGKTGQTADSAAFYLNNLPPGKYGIILLDAASAKPPETVSLILQQAGTDWKLGGLYIKSLQFGGHDSTWFAARAREYKAKGQIHNAWFYFLEARELISPLPFMSTAATDKLYDESQGMQPPDVPVEGKPVSLGAGTANYQLTALFPQAVENDLDLIVRYSASDISNTNQTYASNIAVMKAVLTKYPEVRDAFAAVVARAVDPSGRDYGTMLAMKDIK